jgi:hypothetical protein
LWEIGLYGQFAGEVVVASSDLFVPSDDLLGVEEECQGLFEENSEVDH